MRVEEELQRAEEAASRIREEEEASFQMLDDGYTGISLYLPPEGGRGGGEGGGKGRKRRGRRMRRMRGGEGEGGGEAAAGTEEDECDDEEEEEEEDESYDGSDNDDSAEEEEEEGKRLGRLSFATNEVFDRSFFSAEEIVATSLKHGVLDVLLLAALFSPLDRHIWFEAVLFALFQKEEEGGGGGGGREGKEWVLEEGGKGGEEGGIDEEDEDEDEEDDKEEDEEVAAASAFREEQHGRLATGNTSTLPVVRSYCSIVKAVNREGDIRLYILKTRPFFRQGTGSGAGGEGKEGGRNGSDGGTGDLSQKQGKAAAPASAVDTGAGAVGAAVTATGVDDVFSFSPSTFSSPPSATATTAVAGDDATCSPSPSTSSSSRPSPPTHGMLIQLEPAPPSKYITDKGTVSTRQRWKSAWRTRGSTMAKARKQIDAGPGCKEEWEEEKGEEGRPSSCSNSCSSSELPDDGPPFYPMPFSVPFPGNVGLSFHPPPPPDPTTGQSVLRLPHMVSIPLVGDGMTPTLVKHLLATTNDWSVFDWKSPAQLSTLTQQPRRKSQKGQETHGGRGGRVDEGKRGSSAPSISSNACNNDTSSSSRSGSSSSSFQRHSSIIPPFLAATTYIPPLLSRAGTAVAQGESAAAAGGASAGGWVEDEGLNASPATWRLTPLLSMWSAAPFSARAGSDDGRGSGGGEGGGRGGGAEESSFGLVPVLDRQALMNVFQVSSPYQQGRVRREWGGVEEEVADECNREE